MTDHKVCTANCNSLENTWRSTGAEDNQGNLKGWRVESRVMALWRMFYFQSIQSIPESHLFGNDIERESLSELLGKI